MKKLDIRLLRRYQLWLPYFEPLEIAKAGETVGQVNIHEGRKKLLNVTVAEDYTVFIPHDSKDKIEQVLVAKEDLKAPIKKGEIAGL